MSGQSPPSKKAKTDMMGNGKSNGAADDGFDHNQYSRQVYALGERAMRRLRTSKVLISGMGGVGVEVAKNLILGGVRHVTIHDTKTGSYADLGAQYYLKEADIGKNRAEASKADLGELNDSVTVGISTVPLSKDLVAEYDVTVVTDLAWSEAVEVSKWTREAGKKFLLADSRGLFAVIFNDFGSAHCVEDPDGEQIQEVLIEHIDKTTGDVICLEDARHGLEDGDYVTFSEVKGLPQLNGHKPIPIKVKKPSQFTMGPEVLAGMDGAHTEGGKFKLVKMPKNIAFKSFEESLVSPETAISDFAKMERPGQLHLAWQTLGAFAAAHSRLPGPRSAPDAAAFLSLAKAANEKAPEKLESLDEPLLTAFAYQASSQLCPLTGFVGGVAAQEAMKAVTGLFMPLKQFLYFDALEALPKSEWSAFGEEGLTEAACAPKGSRYDSLAAVFGWDFVESKKSECAAKAAKAFNADLNIEAMSERVGGDTEKIFHDDFFARLTGVANALDNVDARTYMDRRCVYYQLPLLESGTMGPKGNTQVVYPHLTESYSSSTDPPEKSIPICTLKNFPNAIEHTIQWARDQFEGLYSNPAETANQFLADQRAFFSRLEKMHTGQKVEMLEQVVKALVAERPKSAEECVLWARLLFEENFSSSIKQLLYNFPPDQVTSQGVKFWSGSKRCPAPITFDPSNEEHLDFVFAGALLRAEVYKLDFKLERAEVGRLGSTVKIPAFEPKAGLRIAVTEAEAAEANTGDGLDEGSVEGMKLQLAKLKAEEKKELSAVDFEKDDDSNHHMEWITACSNLRAANYKIDPADRIATKKIAGRIIPALATTTAAVAGLVGIELLKVVAAGKERKAPLDVFKNGFLNLALPFVAFSEPIAAPVKEYNGNKFTLWDCLEMSGPMTLGEFIQKFKTDYKLSVSMLSVGVSMLYSFFMPPEKANKRKAMTLRACVEEVTGRAIDSHVKTLVLEPMLEDEEGEDVDTPYVKYHLV